MEITLHTYFNGEAVTLEKDAIVSMERDNDAAWGPEHNGPSDYTRVVVGEGSVTSNGTRAAFVSETPEEILAL